MEKMGEPAWQQTSPKMMCSAFAQIDESGVRTEARPGVLVCDRWGNAWAKWEARPTYRKP